MDSVKPKSPASRKSRLRRWLPWVLALSFVALMVVALWPQPVPVEVAAVSRAPLTVTVLEEGKTRIRHRYIISPPVAGFLERIDWRAGDPVEAGKTVLAVVRPEPSGFLDPRSRARAEAALKAAQAARQLRQAESERAQATLEIAEKDFARFDALRESRAIAEQEWDVAYNVVQVRRREVNAAHFALTVADFEIAQAEAALIQTDAPVDSRKPLRIFSPVNGFVLNVFEDSARVVTAGMPLLEIGDPQDLEAEIELLSSDAVGVALGAPVSIEQWGGDRPLAGRVSLIERSGFTKVSALGVEEQRVRIRVAFDEPPRQVLGDRFRIEARIVTWHGDDVLQIPAGALFRRGNDWMAFVVEDGKVWRRKVGIGHQNGMAAEVLNGLEANARVVVYPPDTLADGVAVTAAAGSGL